MERILTRRDIGSTIRGITALIYHPTRKEILVGYEDGAIKGWDFDSNKPVFSNTVDAHQGWVTAFLWWNEWKSMFSSSLDCTIICWSPTMLPFQRIEVASPIHSLLWCKRRQELVVGTSRDIAVLGKSNRIHQNGIPLLSKTATHVAGHSDIVKCLKCDDSRVYSAGYDNRLIFYDISLSSFAIENKTAPLKIHSAFDNAHLAGITCMVLAREPDSGSWLATGSFDHTIKIWSTDGKAMCVITCLAAVTGICYVPETRILWAAAGTPTPILYEPKSGDNISEFTRILSEPDHRSESTLTVQLVVYESETKQVLGSTNQKELCVWRYSPSYCMCTQFCDAHIETLTYTQKVPILIFSGHIDGSVLKWERLQLNTFLYSHEQFVYKEKLMEALCKEKNDLAGGQPLIGSDPKQGILEKLYKKKVKHALETDSRSFTKSLFVESHDLLVMGANDGRIFVWGFDKEAMKVLKDLQSHTNSSGLFNTGKKNGKISASASEGSVTNRVAGFTCLLSMCKHSHSVSGLAAVGSGDHSFLLTTGWDLLVCVWSWDGQLLRTLDVTPQDCEDVMDTIVSDMDWAQERSEFAFSLSTNDSCVWHLSCDSLEMTERGKLVGHKGEVNQIKWNPVIKNWVSGSDDETIRLWCPKTLKQLDLVQAKGPVGVLMVDKANGYIVTTIREKIQIYDHTLQLIQVNRGHSDVVRCIIHVPELNQYVSTSWDRTLKIWQAPKSHNQRHFGDDQLQSELCRQVED